MKRSGRSSLKNSPTLNNIQQRLLLSPTKSLRKLSSQTGMSLSTVRRATKKLKLHPYRVQLMHELKDLDKQKRLNYCRWFRNLINRNGIDILDQIYYTDEAWFHLSGYSNSQNYRIWSNENPHEFHENPLHSQKIVVW